MQLMIDIPDEIYNYIRNEHISMRVCDGHKVAKAIFDGTPLPKGHGSPCDLCRYNPPSSGDGKPCGMCPACSGGNE